MMLQILLVILLWLCGFHSQARNCFICNAALCTNGASFDRRFKSKNVTSSTGFQAREGDSTTLPPRLQLKESTLECSPLNFHLHLVLSESREVMGQRVGAGGIAHSAEACWITQDTKALLCQIRSLPQCLFTHTGRSLSPPSQNRLQQDVNYFSTVQNLASYPCLHAVH